MSASDKEKDLDELYEWRSFIDKERIKTSNNLDKYILTFSSGILAISVSFTSNLKHEFCNTEVLAFGWIMLIFAIVATLVSIFLSEKAFRREIQITDETIKYRIKDKDDDEINKSNLWNTATDILTLCGIVTFSLGIGLLSYFYFTNL